LATTSLANQQYPDVSAKRAATTRKRAATQPPTTKAIISMSVEVEVVVCARETGETDGGGESATTAGAVVMALTEMGTLVTVASMAVAAVGEVSVEAIEACTVPAVAVGVMMLTESRTLPDETLTSTIDGSTPALSATAASISSRTEDVNDETSPATARVKATLLIGGEGVGGAEGGGGGIGDGGTDGDAGQVASVEAHAPNVVAGIMWPEPWHSCRHWPSCQWQPTSVHASQPDCAWQVAADIGHVALLVWQLMSATPQL